MHHFPNKILCATSTRIDGNLSFRDDDIEVVQKRRQTFLAKHGVSLSTYAPILCNHKETIVALHNVHRTEASDGISAEVVATQKKGIALFLLTADCIPLCFFDPVTETIALAHISRVTLGLGLPQKTVGFLRQQFAVDPRNLLVYLAPHIHKNSYAFPAPLETITETLLPYSVENNGQVYIDITTACIDGLVQSDVAKDNISVSPIDTATSPDHFSYYALKRTGGVSTARIATLLMLK